MTTHITTKPNAKPPTPIEVLRGNMEGEFIKTVTNYYRGNEQEALAFKTASIDYVRKVPKLLECDRISLLSAFVQAAAFRFMPSGVSGESYIIPYGREAKFQLGYQGIVTLLYRTKTVKAVTANIIYANDEFEYEEGLNPRLVHRPVFGKKEKGEAIGAYTVAQLDGGVRTFKVMDKDQILEIKELSKAKNSKESPWNSDKDPELWMWKKTCLLQHAKMLPKSQELMSAIEKDREGEGMDTPSYDAGGVAVGKVFHTPSEPVKIPSKDVTDEQAAEFAEQERRDNETEGNH